MRTKTNPISANFPHKIAKSRNPTFPSVHIVSHLFWASVTLPCGINNIASKSWDAFFGPFGPFGPFVPVFNKIYD